MVLMLSQAVCVSTSLYLEWSRATAAGGVDEQGSDLDLSLLCACASLSLCLRASVFALCVMRAVMHVRTKERACTTPECAVLLHYTQSKRVRRPP